jgi:hypothetical protein
MPIIWRNTPVNGEDKAEVRRHLSQLLIEVTKLRLDRDWEERANRRRSAPLWPAHETHEAKMQEIKAYLRGTGLFVKYCNDPAFECYVLVAD